MADVRCNHHGVRTDSDSDDSSVHTSDSRLLYGCGYARFGKRGLISVAVYVLLGAIGVPVFAGFSGGIGVLGGPTGGISSVSSLRRLSLDL